MINVVKIAGKDVTLKEMKLGELREMKKFVENSPLATFQPLVTDEEFEAARVAWKSFLEKALETYDPSLELEHITMAEMSQLQLGFFAAGMGNMIRS